MFFSLILSACTNYNMQASLLENAYFSHTIYISSSGSIAEKFILNFDTINVTQPEKQSLLNFSLILFNEQKNNLSSYINNKLQNESQEVKDIVNENFSFSIESQGNKLIFDAEFANSKVWSYFVAPQLQNNIENHYFYYSRIDYLSETGIIYLDGENEILFAEHLKEVSLDLVEIYGDLIQIKSVYTYVTPYKRRHSNADEIAYINGYYFHEWNTTSQANIVMYVNLAKVGVWYILAQFLAFFTVGIVFLISYIKKENHSNFEMEINEKTNRVKTKDE